MLKTKSIAAGLLLLTSAGFLHAQTKAGAVKNGVSNAKLIEATSQRIVGGARGQQPHTQYSIVLVWKGSQKPATFFWRGDNGWWGCSTGRGHKMGRKANPMNPDYTATSLNFPEIKKGDTLLITPAPGGKFPIPAEIPATAKNTLYYQLGSSKQWYALPVKNMIKKKDLQAP
jgi:hypothetical protein